jgi:hypothetical protein
MVEQCPGRRSQPGTARLGARSSIQARTIWLAIQPTVYWVMLSDMS